MKWIKPALGNLKCKLMQDFMRTLVCPAMVQFLRMIHVMF